MTTATLTTSDIRLRDTVIRQLDWDPEVDDSAIGAAASGGVVTLTGFIDSYAGKLAAERSVKRLRGVCAVANDLIVRLRVDRTDPEIATDAARMLRLRSSIPETVQATVHNRHITLTGRVPWLHQKQAAADAMHHIDGVLGVMNHIEVAPRAMQRDVRHRIVEALHRAADVDARNIEVTVDNDVATLRGSARSWLEREAAEHAAASAPGIARVDNQVIIGPMDDPDTEC